MAYDYGNYVMYPVYDNHVEPEEEEEWDRECFLDPMWELQQKKTFTAWINAYLRKASQSIVGIEDDLRDGLKLLVLLETLSEEPLPKPDRGRMRFHKIANVNKALDYIESRGVQLVSIGAEEIVDGNIKMTLGMIWTIILRFCIQDITVEEMSAKEGLLLWCQRKTAPYKNVNVQNFHMSWKDGLAFCALIHRHRPELIDYSKLSRDNPLENLNYAFDVAEKHLDIPRMLDAEDMVNTVKPDERSVMTYVAAYYHALAGAQKAETAANRIAKVLKANQDNEHMMADYETLASDLLKWIKSKTPMLKNRTTDGTLPGTKARLDEYNGYRGIEKPPKLEDKAVLETMYNTLQTRLRVAGKPAFLPTEGHLITDIQDAWRELEGYEKGFEDWLLAEIRRLEQIEYLAKKFRLKCATHEAWSDGKAAILSATDYQGANLYHLRALARKQEDFEADLGAHQTRVERIVAIAEELNSLNYHDVGGVNERTQRIVNEWDKLGQISTNRKMEITRMLDILERIDKLQLSFAKRVGPFNNWLEQAHEDLQDMFIVNKVDEISNLISGHDVFKKTLPVAEKEMHDLVGEAKEVIQLVEQHGLPLQVAVNPYTMIGQEVLDNRWDQMRNLVPERDRSLQDELSRQQELERMRQQFAQKANKIGPWLERSLDAINALQAQGKGSLEQQLMQLNKMDEELNNWRPSMTELEQCNTIVQEAGVYHNPLTPYTMDTLRVGWEQLITSIKRASNEIENQITARDAKGVTESQLNEFRRCFNHFDKQRRRRLEHLDFRACLVSLGYNIPKNAEGERDFQRILRCVDPNKDGFVTFEAFMNFMTRQATDSDSVEQMIESFRTLAGDSPYVTADILRRELPSEQAEYCIQKMAPYSGPDGATNALDYAKFSTDIYGESDL